MKLKSDGWSWFFTKPLALSSALLVLAFSHAIAAEIIALKDGQKIVADKVTVERYDSRTAAGRRQGDQLHLYRKVMQFRKSGTNWDGTSKTLQDDFEQIGIYKWDQLGDDSIKKYFPDKWPEVQRRHQAASAPPPPLPTTVITPAQPINVAPVPPPQPRDPSPGAIATVQTPRPPDFVHPIEPDKPAMPVVEVADGSGNIKISGFYGVATGNDPFAFSGRLQNVSQRPLHDISLFFKAGDLQGVTSIGTRLTPEDAANQQAGVFKIQLASKPDLKATWGFLIVSCFEQPSSVPDRKLITISFRVEQSPTGEYRLVGSN